MSRSTRFPGWQPLRTEDGTWTLLHPGHGEACHSRSGAWLEARERYALPCRLHEWDGARPLRLLDVGTGLGLNLAAASAALEQRGGTLDAWTLESDPAVLRATLEWLGDGRGEARHAGPGERWHAPVRAALDAALALDGQGEPVPLGRGGTLHLVLGDAARTLPRLAPGVSFDAVFLDPFSPAREPALWEVDFLRVVAERMTPLALLSTYSAAYRVRLALARAGLAVGRGPRVGAKAEGTLASAAANLPPLDLRVEKRLQADLEALPRPILAQRLRERPPGID